MSERIACKRRRGKHTGNIARGAAVDKPPVAGENHDLVEVRKEAGRGLVHGKQCGERAWRGGARQFTQRLQKPQRSRRIQSRLAQRQPLCDARS